MKRTPINKRSKNKEVVTADTYNAVLDRDKVCQICGKSTTLQLHHINGRGKDKTNNIDNCIMLCCYCHLEIVHKSNKKWRIILNEMIEQKKG